MQFPRSFRRILRAVAGPESAALACALLGACGAAAPNAGNNNGIASVNGSIKSQPFNAADAISAVVTAGGGSSAVVALYDVAGNCDRYGQGKQQHSIKQLVLTLSDTSTGVESAPTSGGTYVVGPQTAGGPVTKSVTASYVATTATCGAGDLATATMGTIALTNVGPAGLSGSGDLTFDSGEHITLSFIAGACGAYRGPGGGAPGCE